MAAGDNEVSLDSHGYLDTENSSRTYLQDLFDSFPTSEPGLYGDFAVEDGSDGEFQIYEEESEGLYSIDDNDDEDVDDDDERKSNLDHTTGKVGFVLMNLRARMT